MTQRARRIVRDGMSLVGIACLAVGAVFCPALLCIYSGVALLAGAVAWQRYEWLKAQRTRR